METERNASWEAGKRAGLGIAALVIGLVSFLSLLGAEKAIVAIALGAIAMRGQDPGSPARRLGIIAIVLGCLFLVTAIVVLAVFREQLGDLLSALQRIS